MLLPRIVAQSPLCERLNNILLIPPYSSLKENSSRARGVDSSLALTCSSAGARKKRIPQTDHTEVVNRVMAQIGSLNLPLEASALLVQSLQAKIAASAPAALWRGGRGGGGSGHAFIAPATAAAPPGVAGALGVQGEAEARGGGLSLQERKLLLDERLQASREAEAAQGLAERRLKMMEVRRNTALVVWPFLMLDFVFPFLSAARSRL